MALYKRNKIYWIDINHNGSRIQKSTGTSDKLAAQELHDKLKADLWQQSKLNKKPQKTWMEAAVRWINESSHKRSLIDDKRHLRWLHPYFNNLLLDDINHNVIEQVTQAKRATGVSIATVNRMLAVIRSILRKATHEWEWLDKTPKIKLHKEDNHRVRWLSHEEAKKLIAELPEHLANMAIFTLATGLRQSNVKQLRWEDINLEKRHAWVHADQAKGNKAIAVPLNETAMKILQKQLGKHKVFVFIYRGHPINHVNGKAWRNALQRAGIENFRWHDLRHTWASWHVQGGTSLQELQLLGGWNCFDMVLRYAHLTSDHLRDAANRIYVTNSLHSKHLLASEKNNITDNMMI
jgi:integrase